MSNAKNNKIREEVLCLINEELRGGYLALYPTVKRICHRCNWEDRDRMLGITDDDIINWAIENNALLDGGDVYGVYKLNLTYQLRDQLQESRR